MSWCDFDMPSSLDMPFDVYQTQQHSYFQKQERSPFQFEEEHDRLGNQRKFDLQSELNNFDYSFDPEFTESVKEVILLNNNF